MTAVLVHYAGRVQGVGFRATAVYIARNFAVTGWVRNMPDGSVELLAEGEGAEVERFLNAIRERWSSSLSAEDRQPQQPSGRYSSFAVTR